MRFVALDVETANPDMASICQVGIVHFENGHVIDSWSSLVNPKDEFDEMNVSIHGITAKDVCHAPDFKQVSTEIHRRVTGQIVAIHTSFDRVAISRACLRHEAPNLDCQWLNTASVARRTWPDVAQKGYGLSALTKRFNINFEHHNAVEDARAAGLILLRAIEDSSVDLTAWLDRVRRPIDLQSNGSVALPGNPEGSLFGEVVVFTGSLSIPRKEAAEWASKAGCQTADGVNKHTTLLVVGDQDIRALRGNEKSNKHRKAEEMITKGYPIRILTESDFVSMVNPS